jgi:cytochrome bd-type quinol oxidase subunit 2
VKSVLDSSLAWFLAFTCIIVGVAWLFLRGTISKLRDFIAARASIYAVAYAKGGCLIALAVGTTFKEVFQPITIEQAAHFAWWDWVIKFSAPVLSGLSVLAAFLDQSAQRARDANTVVNGGTKPPFAVAQTDQPSKPPGNPTT